jgi:chromosome condensin MukBEF ATPase and DNA-binding subunit MukB
MTARTDVERIATLEAEMRGLQDDIRETRKKVEQMHDLLMQAKGAKWAAWLLMVAFGMLISFISDKLFKLLPFMGIGPR